MKTSLKSAPDKGAMRSGRLSAIGLTLALASLFTATPLRAEDVHHGGQQHSQGQGHAAPGRHTGMTIIVAMVTHTTTGAMPTERRL